MKKLYIPTTSLNFNNILSSESISPKAFYEKRSFGYSRWFSIPENNFDNIILLYESFCSFMRPKSDYEDHPLLIEVSLREEDVSTFHQLKDGVYCCDHTIYLTPWNTMFYFFSPEDKKITLSISESSLETKLLKLYSKRFSIEYPKKNYELIANSGNFEVNFSEIEKDIRINKIKGVLYGYYIGALLSTSLELVLQLNVLREILNIFAAILSSIDKIPTEYQQNKLDSLFAELQKSDAFYLKLLETIEDANKTDKVLSIIRSEYGFLKNDICSGNILNDLRSNKEKSESKNSSIVWIENKISHQESIINNKRQALSPNKSEIVFIDNKLSTISEDTIGDKTENLLFKAWINDTLSSKEYNGKISSFKEKLSDDVTAKAKEIYQKKWEDSYAKGFLNKLRRHVRGEDFVQQWNNGVFSSVAAIITNGGEWNKLLVFMQSKEMYNYRLAFAMFGALNGFANLTRNFTDLIYLRDSKYIAEIYTEFHSQLFGHSPIIEVVEQKDPVIPTKNNEEKTEIERTTSNIINKLADCKLKQEQIKSICEIYINNNFLVNDRFFANVKKIKGIGAKALEKIKNALGCDNALKAEPTLPESILFIEEKPQEGSKFYKDKNALTYLAYLLPDDKKVRNQFKTDIEWFQDNHNESYIDKSKGQQQGIYYNKPTDNQSVIERFEKYLENKQISKNPKTDWLRKIYQRIDINQIILKLKELYSL